MADPLSLFFYPYTERTWTRTHNVVDTQNGAFKANIWQRFHLSIRDSKMAEVTTSHTKSSATNRRKVKVKQFRNVWS